MSLVTTDELTDRVETALGDIALQSLLDNIEAEIVGWIGAVYVDEETPITEEHYDNGGRHLYLKRKVSSVETVTEYASISDDGRALTQNYDYSVRAASGMLERVGNWGWKVIVEYVPRDDRAKWREAIIDLARLDIARMPMSSEAIQGEMSYTAPANWEHERARIIHRLMFTDF